MQLHSVKELVAAAVVAVVAETAASVAAAMAAAEEEVVDAVDHTKRNLTADSQTTMRGSLMSAAEARRARSK